MTFKEEREENFERVFEELYVETICMVKKSKELKEQLEAIAKENKGLDEKHRSKEKKEKLKHQLSNKEDINKIFGGSLKLTNMLLHQKNPLCKVRLGGHNHEGEFNKPLHFVKASIPQREKFSHEASISMKDHPNKVKKPLQVPNKEKKPIHAPRREEKLRHVPRKGRKLQQEVTTPPHQEDQPLVVIVQGWSYSMEM